MLFENDKTYCYIAYGRQQETTDPPEMEKIREQYATLFGTFNKLVSLLDYDKTIQVGQAGN
jgi:hypothetical protein